MQDSILHHAFEQLQEICNTDPGQVPQEPTGEDIIPFRDRIDAIDRVILALLNERAICANKIGHIKKVVGLPVYVPSRETEVLENVCSANGGPLDDDAVKRLFERVIDETRSLERHLYQDDKHL